VATHLVPAIVVDGKPLCHLPNSKSCELDRLEIAIRQLLEILEPLGGVLKVYVDASLPHSLCAKDRKRLGDLIVNNQISMTPAGVPADSFILEWADTHNALVVSTDLYREFKGSYPWLSHQGRTIGPSFDEVDRRWMFFERASGRGKVPRSISELLGRKLPTTPLAPDITASEQSSSQEPVLNQHSPIFEKNAKRAGTSSTPRLDRPRIKLQFRNRDGQ